MTDQQSHFEGRWNQRKRDWGVSIWIAFLTACGGTFLLFALIDPEDFGHAWVMGWVTGVKLTFGLGFFFMFALSLAAARLTCFMIRTGPRRGHAHGKGRRTPTEIRDPAAKNPDLSGEDWQ